MAYYLIVTRDTTADAWVQQFGDHDRETVADELNDMWDHADKNQNGNRLRKADHIKMLKCVNASRKACDEAVAKVNS